MAGDESQSPLSVAVLTPSGRGAIATLRVQGDLRQLDRDSQPLFQAANGRPLSQQQPGRIVFGQWGTGSDREEVVVCRIRQDCCEIHCHGGDAATSRILDQLRQAGCEILDWRCQVAGISDTLELECAERLSRATTWRTAEILHEQSSGLLRQSLEELLSSIDDHSSPGSNERFDELLGWAEFGRRLSEPWSVVLTGRPNVGKSSLINALLGYQRAIVFDVPGTTRDVVTAETAFDGWPIQLADTAGLRETTEELEAAGIALARRQLESADARLVLIDVSHSPTREDEVLIHQWRDAIIIGHKCDLGDQWKSRLPAKAIRASSVTGEGLDKIQQRLVEYLVPRIPAPGTPLPITGRQADLLQQTRDHLVDNQPDDARQILKQIFRDSRNMPNSQ